jgi:hypothetical protein
MLTLRPTTSLLLVAEQSDRCRIEGLDAAVRIDHDDAVHGGIDD